MMDEIKGYSILGFVICFQNVSIFNYYHLLRSAEKLLQDLCNILNTTSASTSWKNYRLGAAHFCRVVANSVEKLTQWKFLQIKKFV